MDLRERIIQSSLNLFSQEGYHAVSVNKIVHAAETSKGGFYYHFSSKNEVLFVIHDVFITHALAKAQEAERLNSTPTHKLMKFINEFVKVFDMYQAHLSVFYQEAFFLDDKYEAIIKVKRNEFKSILTHILNEGVESGEFREELNVELTTLAILGMVNWLYKWYDPAGKNSIGEISNIYTDLIIHSVLNE
ncbi:MAG TPA: TetR/AcrR family transcriptional regulator [Pseudogracilibacillus sp.]|nr:TetR/AcrR family transcriptional regulator [Pseudogracilibacillus sp.]